ncbi:hypothetical protein ACHAWU_006999 [Discostella pseudostelligera]|uniref:IQ domain-containing protein D n=1 Tax=Discostella pseudostelligera TaxID=259834 RepID=A0ABD3N978_9STRA
MVAIQQAVEILQQCRDQLELCTQTPLNIESYREELIHECHIAIDLWNELKSSEKRVLELESNTKITKGLSNKMEYSKAANELLVVKKKSKELSSQINKEINTSSIMVKNTKRVKIELDRLDDTLRIAQLELQLQSSESSTTTGNMTPSLQAELEAVPAQLLREQLITQNKVINQALEEVRYTLHREKEDHRELVADIQFEIKTIRDNLDAMANGTYPPAMEFEARQIDRRRNQTNNINNQRGTIQNEIDVLKARIFEDGKVQDATISILQHEQLVLEQRLADVIQYNTTSMHDIETTLFNLHNEQSNITVVLQQFAIRVAKEQEEEKVLAELERARLAELEYEKSIDEKEYFAALWIQLRWKAYCKRKAMKQKSNKKSKKGANGGSKK